MNAIKTIVKAWLGLGMITWIQILIFTLAGWLAGREMRKIQIETSALAISTEARNQAIYHRFQQLETRIQKLEEREQK